MARSRYVKHMTERKRRLLSKAMSMLAKMPRKWTPARQAAVLKAAHAPRPKKYRTQARKAKADADKQS